MNFDEMKELWNEYDRKVDSVIRISTATFQQSQLIHARSSLQALTRWIAVEMVVNAAVVVLVGYFIAHHLGEPRFLLPAVALDVFAIFLVASTAYQLGKLRRSDFSAAIVEMQRRTEVLRLHRIRTNKWALTLAPLLWVPALIVVLKGWLGVDAYAVLPAKWFIANAIFGVAFIPIMLWFAKRCAGRAQSSIANLLMDDLAGRSLASSQSFLRELSAFERDANRDAA